jgi:hypothetical protein
MSPSRRAGDLRRRPEQRRSAIARGSRAMSPNRRRLCPRATPVGELAVGELARLGSSHGWGARGWELGESPEQIRGTHASNPVGGPRVCGSLASKPVRVPSSGSHPSGFPRAAPARAARATPARHPCTGALLGCPWTTRHWPPSNPGTASLQGSRFGPRNPGQDLAVRISRQGSSGATPVRISPAEQPRSGSPRSGSPGQDLPRQGSSGATPVRALRATPVRDLPGISGTLVTSQMVGALRR